MTDRITCQQFIDSIGDYLSGDPHDARFAAHLDGCASCRAYLQSYRQTLIFEQLVDSDEEM